MQAARDAGVYCLGCQDKQLLGCLVGCYANVVHTRVLHAKLLGNRIELISRTPICHDRCFDGRCRDLRGGGLRLRVIRRVVDGFDQSSGDALCFLRTAQQNLVGALIGYQMRLVAKAREHLSKRFFDLGGLLIAERVDLVLGRRSLGRCVLWRHRHEEQEYSGMAGEGRYRNDERSQHSIQGSCLVVGVKFW